MSNFNRAAKLSTYSKILPTIDLPPLHGANLSLTAHQIDPTEYNQHATPFVCLVFKRTTTADSRIYYHTSTTTTHTVPYYRYSNLYDVVKEAIDFLNETNQHSNKEYAEMVHSMLCFYQIGKFLPPIGGDLDETVCDDGYRLKDTAVGIPAHD